MVALFLLDGCKCVGTVLLVLLLNRFVAISISVVIVEVALCFSDGAGVRQSVPSINSSGGARLVCCCACCGRRVPAIDRYLLQAPALSSKCG